MEDPRRGALVPSGHRSAPTEAAAETLDGIFDATEVSSELSCPTAPSVCRPLFSPAGSVGAGRSPLGSALRHKRRRGDTGLCGALASCPLSHGCRRASVSPPARVLAASGRRPAPTDAAAETGCWATSHWDVTALFQKAPPLRPVAPKLAYFSGFMCTSSWG